MFSLNHFIGWALSTLFSGLILLFLPFNEKDVATRRIEQDLNRSNDLVAQIASQCQTLSPQGDSQLERWFVEKLWMPNPSSITKTGGTQKPLNHLPGCILHAEESHANRWGLLSFWKLGFEIQTVPRSTDKAFLSHSYSTSFPLPPALIPLISFLLAIVFDFPFWHLGWTVILYLFGLSGMNLIRMVKGVTSGTQLALLSDPLFLGFGLLSLWLALYRSREGEAKLTRASSSSLENVTNRFITSLLGIWNPAFYSLIGPLIFPIGRQLKRLGPFFDAQLILITMSLFLLGLDLRSPQSALFSAIAPRYFSFTVVFFLLLSIFPRVPKPQFVVWQLKGFWRYLLFVLGGEGLTFIIPPLKSIPNLSRVGLCLLLCECLQVRKFKWRSIWREWKKPLIAVVLSSVLAVVSIEAGMLDLIIAICEPKRHPTAVIPFTFLSGFLLGFISGGLTSPFFIFLSQTTKAYPSPLIRAALFDGLLVGLILSPFSLFNLFPAFEFELPTQELIRIRWKQLALPILMGSVLYVVGTINSVGILQPVSFIFFCLVALTFKLKRVQWKIGTFDLSERSEPH